MTLLTIRMESQAGADTGGFLTMANEESTQIKWQDWSDGVFDRAVQEDKLMLLDISASWCHWCHMMDRTTYSDPRVIDIINDRFVPVKVDADKRPDVQDKYLLGGWPTTAFLIPDGRILTGTTFMPPQAMIHKLVEVDALYHEQKAVVTMHVTSAAAEAVYEREQTEPAAYVLKDDAIGTIVKAMKDGFDRDRGGFGTEPKFPYPDALRLAFLQYRKSHDPELLNIARKTLDGLMGIYDPVWGGFYRYSVTANWSKPHYEKMLYVQADAMDNFLEIYQVTGEDKYGEAAAGIKTYITRFLSDQEKGGFYGSQDADVNSHDKNLEMVPGEDYFPKDEAGRLAIGIPYVDKTIYTDWNGMMASSYLRLYQVMGDKDARDFALKTVDRLLAENVCGDRMCHYSDSEKYVPGALSDQTFFAIALLDAYQTSGKRKYLAQAEQLAKFMMDELQDVVDGGFYSLPYQPHAKGELAERHKPYDENIAAARFFTILHHLTGYQTYRDKAGRTLKAIGYPQVAESIIGAGYALSLDNFLNTPMHIVVVGDKENSRTQEMLQTGLHAYEPWKLVQVLDPEEDPLTIGETVYEAGEEPMAYVCVRNVCRQPITDTDDLITVLEDITGCVPD